MLQDLYPHMYHNEMSWKAPSPDDIALIFEPDHTVYCNLSGETLTLPRMCEIPDGGEAQYAFSILVLTTCRLSGVPTGTTV